MNAYLKDVPPGMYQQGLKFPNKGIKYYIGYADVGVSTTSAPWSSNDDLALQSKLRERVAGSSFNLASLLADGNRTVAMIGHIAHRIDRAYRAVQRLDFKTAFSWVYQGRAHARKVPRVQRMTWKGETLTGFAQNFLMLQYGIRPLIQDVKDGAEFLAHHYGLPLKQRYSARRKREGSASSTSPTLWMFDKCTHIQYGQIIAYLEERDIPALAGLYDIPSWLWERQAFSFVADWFIPIGSYLQARAFARSLKATFITTRTNRTKATGLLQVPKGGYDGVWLLGGPTNLWRNIIVSQTRTVSTTLEVPKPSFKGFERALTWEHSANAVALLIQGFGSSFNKRPMPNVRPIDWGNPGRKDAWDHVGKHH